MKKPWTKVQREAEINPEIYIPECTLPDIFNETVQNSPEEIAIIFYGHNEKFSYKELSEKVDKLANAFHRIGIKKGDRVSLMLPNSPDFVISYYALLKLGAIIANTNPMYVEREVEHLVNDSGAETIIALDKVVQRILNIKERTNLDKIILTNFKREKPQDMSEKVFWLWDLIDNNSPDAPSVEVNASDPAVLQYTGGTTGTPKAATLSHYNLVANVAQVEEADYTAYRVKYGIENDRKAVGIGVLPFFHVFGMTAVMNATIKVNGTMILFDNFDAGKILEAINEYSPRTFYGVPTMYIALLNHPEIDNYDLSKVMVYITGGSAMPVEVEKAFDKKLEGSDSKLLQGFGLSECSPVTHLNPLCAAKKVGSIGIPYPNTDCKVVDTHSGEEVPVGEVGELCMKGPQVMLGYWQRPAETELCLRNGWFYTGDMGRMDEDGYFYIVDRKKDMIVASGYNVYPAEIENVIHEIPQVLEVSCVGVPDKYRGETVKAFVVLKENENITSEEIVNYCKEKLAPFKVPKVVEFKEELPKSKVGKILKRVLREESTEN